MAWPCSTVRLTSESGSLKSKRVVNDDAVLLEHCGNGQSIPGQMQPLYLGYERELAAFFTAIDNLFGPEQARRSAINWIEELDSIDGQSEDSMPNWRQATVAASALLSASHCRKVSRPNYEALENWSNGGRT